MASIPVQVPGVPKDHQLHIELVGGVGKLIKKIIGSLPTTIVADASVAATHAEVVAKSLQQEGVPVVGSTSVVAEESNKTLETAGALCDAFLAQGLERRGAVVAVGGGLVGDLAGFAAATYKRGVPLVLVPTTLLAMVDASIGGKTAVNRRLPDGTLGKNLIGAFWPPRAIVTDPSTLSTLPDRELRCGLAECVKHGLVGDPGLIEVLESQGAAVLRRDPAALAALIQRSAQVKIRIVAEDPLEDGRRAELNLGHTFGHALEPMESLRLKHGEAVSLGLVAAMSVAVRRGALPRADAERIERLLARLGLPVRLAGTPDRARLMQAMAHDKKNLQGRVRLVLPMAIGRAALVDDAAAEEIARAWEAIGA